MRAFFWGSTARNNLMDLWTFAARQGAMDSLWTTESTLTTGSPHPRPTSSTGSITGYQYNIAMLAICRPTGGKCASRWRAQAVDPLPKKGIASTWLGLEISLPLALPNSPCMRFRCFFNVLLHFTYCTFYRTSS